MPHLNHLPPAATQRTVRLLHPSALTLILEETVMQIVQAQQLFSLRAIRDFLLAHADTLHGVIGTSTMTKLGDGIVELAGHASDQSGNTIEAQGATKKHRALRTVLTRTYMSPIARVARIALSETPEIESLRMPTSRTNVEQLVAAARGMATAATPHAATFIAAGLPADFIGQLQRVSDAMLDSVRERRQSLGRAAGATTRIGTGISEARHVVQALDALVRVALKDEPNLLANWEQVKRVRRTRGRAAIAATSTSAVSPEVAPVTTAVAA